MAASNASHGGFRFENVDVGFGDLSVLKSVSFSVLPQQKIAIVGPSGAGKTTILKLLNAAVPVSAGHVWVNGQDVSVLKGKALKRLRTGIGFVYQDLRLVGNLRVHQNVLSGRFGSQSLVSSFWTMVRPSSEQQLEVYRLLGLVGIPEKMYHRTSHLSGGQAQRVAVARALYQQPIILLADEPVSSVDPARAQSIIKLLVGVSDREKLTLCVSLHDPDLVRTYFDRVVGLRAGKILFDKDAAAVTDDDLSTLYELEGQGEQ